jgi:hypothetical protein
MEQYWMDENDRWSIELDKVHPLYQNSITKRICITCKAQTSLGQSQKTNEIHLGPELVLKNRAILDG